jgi:hypothetical protein
MKKILLSILLLTGLFLKLSAQCLTLSNCPADVNTGNDAGVCGTVVNFSTPTMNSTCAAIASDTFQYSGAMQTYVVPAGVTTVTIEAWGAQGGANWANNVNFGGYSKADFSVTPGETLYIFVGGQATSITGGFNGGGNGEGAGKGGGGGSDVRQGGTTYNERIIVGGGGGGAGYWSSLHVVGGVGGGLTGGNGYRDPDFASNPGGKGGSQTAGGPDGTCINYNVTALAGGFGYGGAPAGCGCEGYGGGGGWYGGAGSGNCRGGGGGSGYILPIASNPTLTAGVRTGNGKVVISYNSAPAPTLTQTAGLSSGSTFPIGITTNTFTASDAFGNTATCSFLVTVTDNEAPTMSPCPADMTMCPGIVTFANAPAVTDNCSATIAQTSGPSSGDSLTAGTYVVNYLATDASGNTTSCSFTITVNPNPAVTLDLGALSFACLNNASFTLTGENPAGGVWSGPGVSGSTFDPATAGAGFQPITYTYVDTNGCMASANDTIQVDVCTGITQEGIEIFRMYPNPASTSFWLIAAEKGIMEVLDVNGKLLKTENITANKQEINLNGFANGTYLVRFTSEKGNVSTGELLIQK